LRIINKILLIGLSGLSFFSCKKDKEVVNPVAQKSLSAPTSNYESVVASDWLDMHLLLIKATPGFTPPVAARALGYHSLALYESVVYGMKDYNTLNGKLNGLSGLPAADTVGKEYNWPLVASTAQYTVLKEIYITASDRNKAKIDSLKTVYENKLKVGITNVVIDNSVKLGASIASGILDYAKKDGGANGHLTNYPAGYTVATGIGYWKPTSTQKIPLLPNWGQNRPMVKENTNNYLDQPISFSFEKSSDFFKEAKSLYENSQKLTAEQKAIAQYFEDGTGTVTPPGHHFNVVKNILKSKKAKLDEVALVYLKTGLSLNDAFIACWKGKYTYNLMRPVTYINESLDKNWRPLLNTPPFPEYASGHSTAAGAVVAILEDAFGKKYAFDDITYFGTMPNRKYADFESYGQETSNSRVYGGIHYKFSCDNGYKNGKKIAENVLKLKIKK